MVEDKVTYSESAAFKEYASGVRKKIKTPWLAIILVGVFTALISFLTGFFAQYALDNPYALNFVIALYGIPAGFIIAFKNKTLSFLVSFQYSSYSALVYSGCYFLFGLANSLINQNSNVGQFFAGILGLVLTCLVIAAYSVLFTFAVGALIGTFASGVIDDRK